MPFRLVSKSTILGVIGAVSEESLSATVARVLRFEENGLVNDRLCCCSGARMDINLPFSVLPLLVSAANKRLEVKDEIDRLIILFLGAKERDSGVKTKARPHTSHTNRCFIRLKKESTIQK